MEIVGNESGSGVRYFVRPSYDSRGVPIGFTFVDRQGVHVFRGAWHSDYPMVETLEQWLALFAIGIRFAYFERNSLTPTLVHPEARSAPTLPTSVTRFPSEIRCLRGE